MGQAHEPDQLTAPLPEPLLRAFVCVAWLRGWKKYAVYLLHSFYGMHRDIESRKIIRQAVIWVAIV